jgi:hypothetical protein
MPRGPQGQKRPADVIGAAVMVARIATGVRLHPKGTKRKAVMRRTSSQNRGRQLRRPRGALWSSHLQS